MATLLELKEALESAVARNHGPLGTESVQQILAENLPSWEEIAPLVPHEHPYGRVTLFESHDYEVMIGCWDKGNWCDAHDHGPSEGAVYAYQGTIEHASYEMQSGVLAVSERCTIGSGELLPLPIGMIHSLANNISDEPYVGLHIYSPPTKDVRVFHLSSGDIYHITNDHGAWVPSDPSKILKVERNAFAFRNQAEKV
jgi:uncharacterized RmlC-like cupin family protein